jgi:hypothetical protein
MFRQKKSVDHFHIPVKFEVFGQSLEQGLGLPGGDGEEYSIARLDSPAQGFPGAQPLCRFHPFSFRAGFNLQPSRNDFKKM